MKKMTLVTFVLVGMIGGCGPQPDRRLVEECQRTTPNASRARWDCLQRASAQTEYLQRQEYIRGIAQQCDSFGMQRGTPAFNQCVYQQQQIEAQNAANAETLRMQRQQLELQQMQRGLQMMNPPRPSNPIVTCTRMPGSYTTTCY